MNLTFPMRRCTLAVLLCLCVYLWGAVIGRDPALFSLVLYAQTGQIPTAAPSDPPNFTSPTEITQPAAPAETGPEAVLSFSPDEIPQISWQVSPDADPEGLLCGSLSWNLTVAEPTVLIVHTHTTEGYADTYDRENFRTREETGNMIAIGDEVARVLALGGVTAIHDRTIHDDPDYSGAYAAARKTIEAYLTAYPSIRIVLDLHRDAVAGETPLITAATVDGQKSAQLALVLGSNFPGWEQNLGLGLKLFALLEREAPGITRPISVRAKSYNLDLCPGSLLVEVGATGNTKQEAIIAANSLARAILQLAKGTK